MSDFRLRSVLFTITIGLWLILAASGPVLNGQTSGAPHRIAIDQISPPAIELGIDPDMSHAPDSPETRRARSLQSDARTPDRVGASGNRYVAGRVIVRFRDGMSPQSKLSALSATSATAAISDRPSYADFDVVTIDRAEDAESVATAFRERSDVEYAQASYRVYPLLVPNDKFYPKQWNLPMIDLERAWDIQPSAGSSITVAVLDTGIAYTTTTLGYQASSFKVADDGSIVGPSSSGGTLYPALGRLNLSFVMASELQPASRFVAPMDFIWADGLQPVDLDLHGTHVTGTIGQLTNNANTGTGDTQNGGGTAGVAFNVKIMPVKVISTQWDDIFGSPFVGTDDVVARGIRYAADNGANVINMSLGRPGPNLSPVMESAMRYAVGKGVFISVSAGNSYEDGNPIIVPAEACSRINGAVSVAAVDRSKSHAYYSSTGSWVELAAPGGSFRGFPNEGGILQQTLDFTKVETYLSSPSTFGPPRFDVMAYVYVTGTSMAAPHVSGAAAMLMQQGIKDPAAVEAALEQFAVDLGDPGRDPVFGFGLVNVRNALRGLGLAR